MILPKEVIGKNKIRDASIIKLFLQDNMTLKDIGLKFNLTASRIHQILYTHNHLISWDKNYEKAIRVNALKRLHDKHPNAMGKKSTLDIIDHIRKEIEGDKPIIDQSVHKHITVEVVTNDGKDKVLSPHKPNNRMEGTLKV